MRRAFAVAGVAVLAGVWLGALPSLSREWFAAHMTVHMAVVAIAAPFIALSLAGARLDPVIRVPQAFGPIAASLVELVVVWVWHAPALHHAARQSWSVFALEQASFLAAGLLLWLAAFAGASDARGWRAGAGAVALLFTSMHMTLLGALFALTPRVLYAHGHASAAALADQQLGGVIMLLVGGASYLAGGLWLVFEILRDRMPARARPATEPRGRK